MLLDDILAKYHKLFGIPLYLDKYGSCKLVNLIKNVSDAFYIEGKGNRKFLCLRESAIASHTHFFLIPVTVQIMCNNHFVGFDFFLLIRSAYQERHIFQAARFTVWNRTHNTVWNRRDESVHRFSCFTWDSMGMNLVSLKGM